MNYLKADLLEKFPGIDHGFGTAGAPPPADVLLMTQKHTNTVIVIDTAQPGSLPVADAMLTGIRSVILGVKTADCIPVLLYNPGSRVVGVIHAGWRGLASHILTNTIEKLHTFYHAPVKDTYVAIGPCICRNCYEVGMEVSDRMIGTKGAEAAFTRTSADKGLLDLTALACRELVSAGIPEANIAKIDRCTKCSPGFYSHRAGSRERQISYITLL